MDDTLAKVMDLEARVKALESKTQVRTGKIGPSFANFLNIPGLRGLWSAGNINDVTSLFDLTGQGRTLTSTGQPVVTLSGVSGVVPALIYTGTGLHSRASEAGLQIVGNEATIVTSLRGLTVGGWVMPHGLSGLQTFASKRTAAGNQSAYILDFSGTTPQFRISTDGLNLVGQSSTVTAVNDQWMFLVGRFTTTGGRLATWVNGTMNDSASGIATIFGSTAPFQLAARDAGTLALLNGDIAIAFLSAVAVPDYLLSKLFNTTRSLFGV